MYVATADMSGKVRGACAEADFVPHWLTRLPGSVVTHKPTGRTFNLANMTLGDSYLSAGNVVTYHFREGKACDYLWEELPIFMHDIGVRLHLFLMQPVPVHGMRSHVPDLDVQLKGSLFLKNALTRLGVSSLQELVNG